MKDTELRELCRAYFDAVERHDVDRVAELCSPDFKFWVNLTGAESSREQNLETLRAGHALHRRRTYDDRRVDTFESGFIARYSVNVVTHRGRRASLWACAIAQCKDGRITHVDEYLDSSKFGRPRKGKDD
ncbi:MAG: nuclear transport factor 2 family protein [Myxococcota bacterium]